MRRQRRGSSRRSRGQTTLLHFRRRRSTRSSSRGSSRPCLIARSLVCLALSLGLRNTHHQAAWPPARTRTREPWALALAATPLGRAGGRAQVRGRESARARRINSAPAEWRSRARECVATLARARPAGRPKVSVLCAGALTRPRARGGSRGSMGPALDGVAGGRLRAAPFARGGRTGARSEPSRLPPAAVARARSRAEEQFR